VKRKTKFTAQGSAGQIEAFGRLSSHPVRIVECGHGGNLWSAKSIKVKKRAKSSPNPQSPEIIIQPLRFNKLSISEEVRRMKRFSCFLGMIEFRTSLCTDRRSSCF
jgi:hypothetical protein